MIVTMEKESSHIHRHVVLKRSEPQGIERLVELCIKELKLEAGFNDMRIFAAWDKVSGAAAYTVSRYFRGGTLYCRLSSSVVRSMLMQRRRELIREVNEALKDESEALSGKGETLQVRNIVLQ